MKIGIYTPIGNLDKYGYQYNYETILNNLQNFGDEILLISSSRENREGNFKKFNKIKFISNNKTQFEIKNNKEVYSLATQIKNQGYALDYFKKNNFDVYLIIHINQYIPENSAVGIRNVCRKMIDEKKPYEWLYKKYQLHDIIFNSDFKLPWIINLRIDNPYRVKSDSIKNRQTKEIIKIEHGNFKKYNNRAIVDVLGEFTLENAKEKYEFTIEELRKLNKTFNPNDRSNLIFNKEKFLKYHLNKINKKIKSTEKLDKTGKEFLKNTRPNFLSHFYRKNYAPIKKNFLIKLISQIKGVIS